MNKAVHSFQLPSRCWPIQPRPNVYEPTANVRIGFRDTQALLWLERTQENPKSSDPALASAVGDLVAGHVAQRYFGAVSEFPDVKTE
jgi:hypothetical protein